MTAQLERRVGDFDAQRQTIERAVIEATRVMTILSALEARVTALAGGDQGLGYAETTVGQLEQRATATMADLERRLDGFDGRKRSIEQALFAVCTESDETLGRAGETVGWLERQATETTAQFERRVSYLAAQKQTIEQALATSLTEGDQRLAQAQETVRRLEHQGVETAAQLERRVNDFDARTHTIERALVVARDESDRALGHAEETLSRLGQQAAETTSSLDRRVNDFDARKHTIEQSLIAALAASDRGLERAAGTVGQLEQRAATAAAGLDRRITDFDTQQQTIARAVAEATRAAAILSALEQRVATVADSANGWKQAEATVEQLERRAADAKTRLEQVVTNKHEIQRELERVEQQLQALAKSARTSIKVLRSTDPSRSIASSLRWPLSRWATILVALIALQLLGLFMLRTRDQPLQTASNTPVAQRSRVPAVVPPLPSKGLRLATFAMPAGSPGAPPPTIAASEPFPATARERARATRTQPTAAVSRVGEPANQTVQQYVGALTIDSEPAGSAVFVDQQRVGETPLQLTGLRAGSHVVRIERNGFDRWTTAVLVAADKQTRVSARLQAVRGR
jgi:chromosome segregation ATPase